MYDQYNVLLKKIPNELYHNIFILANNKCNTCNNICIIPFKKISRFYYCSQMCYFHY